MVFFLHFWTTNYRIAPKSQQYFIKVLLNTHSHAGNGQRSEDQERKRRRELRGGKNHQDYINSTMCAAWHGACFRFEKFALAFGGFVGILVIPLSILFAISTTGTANTFAPSTIFTNLTITCYNPIFSIFFRHECFIFPIQNIYFFYRF